MNDPLDLLTNLEKAYEPSSPLYKFTHTFHNLADPSGTTYPIDLKGYDDLIMRNKHQKAVIDKLNSALLAMSQRIDGVIAKSMIINQKMGVLVKMIRSMRGYGIDGKLVFGRMEGELVCGDDGIRCLRMMRRVLVNLSESVKKEIGESRSL
ncbi:hypothetical protein THOM_0721 [Trachipleistophora hominis]|uniref:Uncharacterized protein n=1 Tax=Trachipleistophora hominis TaxID=72359 RepID=L7JZV6_TRAHO|nr:hypothetical protein THOM_0721 [Trachipleistophora hominis]